MPRRKLTTETVPIESLKPHPRNYRGHPEEQLEHIKRSIAEHGQYRPVVVSRDSTILAGHGVWMGMDEMTRKRIDVVRLPINAESPEALRILTGDNEISGVAVDDKTALGDLLRELADHDATLDSLLGTGYDATRLVELLAETGNTAELPDHLLSHFHNGDDQRVDPGPSKPAEAQARWKVETGDVWTVGDHRIVCGDAADGAAMASALRDRKWAAIITDPPYGVAYQGGQNIRLRPQMTGDTDARLYAAMLTAASSSAADGAPIYTWFASTQAASVYAAAEATGYTPRAMIIWNKLNAHYGAFMSHYMPKHEACLYAVLDRANWYGPTNEVTVWDIEQPTRNEHHPTQKPVECMARPLRNSTRPGEVVLDPFAGSGTTLIACEQANRVGAAIDIDPSYVAVTLERLAGLGLEPRREPVARRRKPAAKPKPAAK